MSADKNMVVGCVVMALLQAAVAALWFGLGFWIGGR